MTMFNKNSDMQINEQDSMIHNSVCETYIPKGSFWTDAQTCLFGDRGSSLHLTEFWHINKWWAQLWEWQACQGIYIATFRRLALGSTADAQATERYLNEIHLICVRVPIISHDGVLYDVDHIHWCNGVFINPFSSPESRPGRILQYFTVLLGSQWSSFHLMLHVMKDSW